MICEALDYLDPARSRARWVRPPLHPGKFLELVCRMRIGYPEATIDTRGLRTGPRHEVLSEYVLGVMRGYRLVQVTI